jgi:hypothetical protein
MLSTFAVINDGASSLPGCRIFASLPMAADGSDVLQVRISR